MEDVDDEVRDRAALYLKVIKDTEMAETYVKEGWHQILHICFAVTKQLSPESVFSLSALEQSLVAYVKDPSASEQPFSVEAIPRISREQAAKESARASLHHSTCLICMHPNLLDVYRTKHP